MDRLRGGFGAIVVSQLPLLNAKKRYHNFYLIYGDIMVKTCPRHITQNIVRLCAAATAGQRLPVALQFGDSIVVGKYSADALAAVTTSGLVINAALLHTRAGHRRDGCLVAVLRRRQNPRRTPHGIHRLIFLAGRRSRSPISGAYCSPTLLRLLKVDPDILPDASIYLRTIFAGILFVMSYNAFASILNAIGDSVTPLFF